MSCVNNSNIENARQDLLYHINKENIEGAFNFEAFENDTSLFASFINKSIGKSVFLETRDTNLLIGIYLTKNKIDYSITILTIQLLKQDSLIYLEVFDLKKKVAKKNKFPQIKPDFKIQDFPFNSVEECLDEYYESQEYLDILAQVNRACQESLLTGPCCPLKDGTFVCVDLIIQPTSLACSINRDIVKYKIPVILIKLNKNYKREK